MAYMTSPRARQFPRDGRGGSTSAEFGRGGSTSEYQQQRDHNHHDYTNIQTGSSNHDNFRNEASSFIPIKSSEGNQEFRDLPHPSVRTEDGPASPNVRTDAPTLYGRGVPRENGERRRRTTSSSYNQLRDDLVRQGALYEDKAFPPNDTSVYFSRQPPLNRPIEWMRPWKICAPHRPVFVHGGFERFDVKQGQLGDCWFVAAMACLCGPDHHRLLQRVVPGNQSFHEGYAGIFRFNFWHFGEWREVVIDDQLPTISGTLKFVHSSNRTEFWAALMEKAYAKLYGSYEALKGGLMSDSLTDLTGGVAESYTLRGKLADFPKNIISILQKALGRRALIGCSIAGEGAKESLLPNGLFTGHAYSVTDLKKIPTQTGEVVLIRVRNPHGGRIEWKGAWNDRSSKWQQLNPEDRAALGLIQRDDGEFWMDFDDFMENFDGLVICNLSPDAPVAMPRKWYSAHHQGRWVRHFNAGGRPQCKESHWANPQYVLKLQDTDDDDTVCSVIIQLMQKDRRKLKQKGEMFRYIGFLIYKVPPGYSVPLKKDFFEHNHPFERSDSFTNTRQIVKRFALPPGVYVVVPCTWDKDQEADFYMRFFFEKGNVSEYADELPEKVEVPPPTPSPKYREQEEQFQKFFYKMSGENMEISCFELHKAVNEALSKEPLHREIGLDACRSFVSLMDVDNSGHLGYTEFLYLWHVLRSWKKTFLQHDLDNSGKMDSHELRTALAANGYKVSNQMLAAAVFRYADSRGNITLDNFLILMAKLMQLFSVYQKHQKNDRAIFTLQQWVEESLRM